MLKAFFFATFLCVAGAEGAEIPLKNADFEQPIVGNRIPGWSRTQHAGIRAYEISNDVASFAHGKQSIRMRRTVEQVYGLILQQLQTVAVSAKEIELTASLKTAGVGEQGWVMLLNFMNHNTVIEQHRATPVVGDSDWSEVTLRKIAPPSTTAIEVGFMLLDGGTGWVDHVRLRAVDEDANAGGMKGKRVTEGDAKPAASKDFSKPSKPIPPAPKKATGVGKPELSIPKAGTMSR